MRRKLFTVASALMMLIFVATVVAWVVGPRGGHYKLYTSSNEYGMYGTSRLFVLRVMGGTRLTGGGFRAPPGKHWDGRWANPTHRFPLGFAYGKSPGNDPTAAFFFGLVIPWWSLAVTSSLLPLLWVYMQVFRPILSPGQCRSCGYDLTGNTSGVCPECGKKLVAEQRGFMKVAV
jgi:hypothetical protein